MPESIFTIGVEEINQGYLSESRWETPKGSVGEPIGKRKWRGRKNNRTETVSLYSIHSLLLSLFRFGLFLTLQQFSLCALIKAVKFIKFVSFLVCNYIFFHYCRGNLWCLIYFLYIDGHRICGNQYFYLGKITLLCRLFLVCFHQFCLLVFYPFIIIIVAV